MKAACFARLFICSLLQLACSLAALIVHLAGARQRSSSSLLMQNSLCFEWECYLTSVNVVLLEHADLPARFQRWIWSAGGNSGPSTWAAPAWIQMGMAEGKQLSTRANKQPVCIQPQRNHTAKHGQIQAPTCSRLAVCLKVQIHGKVIKGLANSPQLPTRGDAVVLRLCIQERNLQKRRHATAVSLPLPSLSALLRSPFSLELHNLFVL